MLVRLQGDIRGWWHLCVVEQADDVYAIYSDCMMLDSVQHQAVKWPA